MSEHKNSSNTNNYNTFKFSSIIKLMAAFFLTYVNYSEFNPDFHYVLFAIYVGISYLLLSFAWTLAKTCFIILHQSSIHNCL